MILQELGQATALIMVMGFAFNILFALITPWKYIFLTGHHSLFMAGLLALELHLLGLDGLILILAGGAILGLLQVVMPAFGQKAITRVTGDTSYSIGHFNTLSYVLAGFIGEKLGNAQDSTENVKFPSCLEFLKDGMASTGITMFILFMVVELFATPQFIEKNISQGQNWLVFAMVQAFIFSAGVSVVLYGVGISLKEIVPAFQGIAQKVIPNARPALDCPIVFPFAPNAMIIGFISSLAGGLISLVIMGMIGLPVVIPALVPHFFLGAVTAIIGNAYGGKRGAIAASFVNGVITSFGAVLLLPYLGIYGAQNVSFSDSDFHWVGILLGTLRNFIQF
jgi:PTS system ascorbate-specific IIC component